VRGLPHNYNEMKSILQSGVLCWSLIIPVFVFFQKDIDNVIVFLKGMYYLTIVFLIVSIIKPSLISQFATGEAFMHPFAFGAGFLLMNAKYLTRKKAIICLIATILAILAFTYLARRNAILTFSGFLVTAFFLNLKGFSFAKAIKFFPVIAFFFILGVLYIDKIPASFTAKITERAKEDTRSDLFTGFFKDMQNDMLIGRGMNGFYYYPVGEIEMDEGVIFAAMDYRNAIENGYLHLILKGGYVEVVLFVLVLFPAGCLGILNSSNSLSRSCGVLIILWLLDMFVYGLPNMGLQYVFVWVSVGICYKTSFRKIPEEEVYEAFKKIELG
jgi:hypothetical protein